VHVAIITTSYPDEVPGSEAAGSFVEDFARQLARSVRVTVIAPASSASKSQDDDLEVIRFAVPSSPLSLLRPLHPADWPAIVKTMRNGRRAVERLVRDNKPNYLFALWALPSGHWAASVSRRHNVPFAIWALGSDIWSLGRIPLLRWKLRRVLRAADRCFADGLALSEDVQQLSGRSCEFLPSTRILPKLEPRSGAESAPYKLAFLGRWHRNKGVDILLESLRQLDDSDWSKISAVRIFGGGPLYADVQRITDELQAQKRPVETGGYLDKESAADLIAWADYLMLPSRIESIPVIFSDAMQLRTPIVATPVGDLPRLHDKYSFGTLAAAAAPDAFTDAMRRALDGSAASFGAGIEAAASDFDMIDLIPRFLGAIEHSGL
jgi:glycosyltransferase involved in cell wall biosynthesis